MLCEVLILGVWEIDDGAITTGGDAIVQRTHDDVLTNHGDGGCGGVDVSLDNDATVRVHVGMVLVYGRIAEVVNAEHAASDAGDGLTDFIIPVGTTGLKHTGSRLERTSTHEHRTVILVRKLSERFDAVVKRGE